EQWDALDKIRREFVRGMRVLVAPILGNDVIIATSHSGANDFYCFAHDRSGAVPSQHGHIARDLERSARLVLKSIDVDPIIADEVTIFAGGATTLPNPTFAPRILYNAVREAKDAAE